MLLYVSYVNLRLTAMSALPRPIRFPTCFRSGRAADGVHHRPQFRGAVGHCPPHTRLRSHCGCTAPGPAGPPLCNTLPSCSFLGGHIDKVMCLSVFAFKVYRLWPSSVSNRSVMVAVAHPLQLLMSVTGW